MIDWNQVKTAEHKRAERLSPERIAARRYQAETGGFEFSGIRIETDDRAKLMINGAAVEAMIDPGYVLNWKTQSGFVTLNGDQVIAIARAVRAHVQACFDREAELLALGSDITDEDLESGWPA